MINPDKQPFLDFQTVPVNFRVESILTNPHATNLLDPQMIPVG
jgi:hypothetical protein